MSRYFEELDWRPTPIGALSLRRRRELRLDIDVYEIMLAGDFLMSSLFTAAEIELARLSLTRLAGRDLEIVVGGLGLGYTAQAVLEDSRVGSVIVVEALPAVIEWHEEGLLPLGRGLATDPRCRLVEGDFFEMISTDGIGPDPDDPDRRFDGILVDIDHTPRHVLDSGHAGFYEPEGLRRLAGHLRPGGVFGLWSNDPPDEALVASLGQVFADSKAHVVRFHNPLQDREAANTGYVGQTGAEA